MYKKKKKKKDSLRYTIMGTMSPDWVKDKSNPPPIPYSVIQEISQPTHVQRVSRAIL